MIILEKVQLFKSLPKSKFLDILREIKVINFSRGDRIITQGEEGDSFFIIKSGVVDIKVNGVSKRQITTTEFFGERALLLSDTRQATAVAMEPTTCWYLNKDSFNQILDLDMRKILEKRMELQDDSIELENLHGVKLLGSGMFGDVYLCVDRNKHVYALKGVGRKKIDKFNMSHNLLAERNLLFAIDHVMIVKLVKTFKDSKRVYFLLEYVHGIDLFDALREMGLITEKDSKFYIGCLLLALEHLNEKRIAHRDLKPENIMVDSEGYPRLIDFGTAKIVEDRTYTQIGTPHYMSPEVIKGTGHTLTTDVWSLAIMFYECIAGYLPFGDEERDPYNIQKIVL